MRSVSTNLLFVWTKWMLLLLLLLLLLLSPSSSSASSSSSSLLMVIPQIPQIPCHCCNARIPLSHIAQFCYTFFILSSFSSHCSPFFTTSFHIETQTHTHTQNTFFLFTPQRFNNPMGIGAPNLLTAKLPISSSIIYSHVIHR